MACSIQFVRLTDFAADIDVLDLSENGYSLAEDGYMPVSAPDGVRSVNEVITLKLQGTSKDDLAAMTQDLDEKIKQVGWWLNDSTVERYQVWIRIQLENETYPQQAQILSILPPDKVQIFRPEEWRDNYIGQYSIAIERTAFWEAPLAASPTPETLSNVDVIGGIATLSTTINGDVPARLAKVAISSVSAPNYQGEWWIGWKSSRLGNAANFQSVWSLDKSAYVNAASGVSVVADATAYDGNKLQCTFADATLVTRSHTFIKDVISDSSKRLDQRGTYQVLLRAKLSGSGTTRARILYSFGSSNAMYSPVYRSRVIISGTNWSLYDMGVVSIPAFRILPGFSIGNAGIGIQAERITGSSNLDLDCLILIPNTEGSIHLISPELNIIPTQGIANIFQYADGAIISYPEVTQSSVTEVYFSTSHQPNKWGLPVTTGGSSILVFAAQQLSAGTNGISTLGKKSNISYIHAPRFRTLRGNVT